jgi:uncharacterized repeat protein (TIGR01451 family)
MKKNFFVVLVIVICLTCLFPAASTGRVSANQSSAPVASARPMTGPAGSDLAVTREWMFTSFGSGIGAAGLVVQDLTGDGTLEIVAGGNAASNFGSDNLWYVIRQTGPQTYSQIWYSSIYTSSIRRITAGNMNNDGIVEIFVALEDASVHIYRGSDFSQLAQFSVEFPARQMRLADCDGNGAQELLISSDTTVAAYNPINQQLLWKLTSYGGDFSVGNVDGDPQPEIVLSTGYVLNGTTRAVEWSYSAGFGSMMEAGDIDGDGMDEIVGSLGWSAITIFDADLKSPMWEVGTSLGVDTLSIADTDGDTRPELLYGDDQWGSVHCVDGQTHKELWKIANPDHGVTAIAVGDVDQDDALEVLWGAGYTSTGPDFLYVADISSGVTEWKSEDIVGPFSVVTAGDVDDDGEKEIVLASNSNYAGSGDSLIKIFNAETYDVEWQIFDIPNISAVGGIGSIRMGDVDQDGETEFVIATANYSDGLIQIYNGRSHQLERQSLTYDGDSFTSMEIGDVDGDQQAEIVVGQHREHTGASGVHIVVFDGATAQEEWQSISLGNFWGEVDDIHLVDVDDDGRQEILAANTQSVYIFDGVTQVLEGTIATHAYAITSADLDHDGTLSILVGGSDGKITFYNGKTKNLEKSISIGSSPITCLALEDVDQNYIPEWLVCSANKLTMYSSGGDHILWQSEDLGSTLGKYNQFSLGNLDQDDSLELLIGSDLALYQFDVPWAGPLGLSHMAVSAASAEVGDLLTYSVVLENQGKEDYPLAQVDNSLPSGLNYMPDSLSASSGTADYANGKITWSGALTTRSTVSFTYQVQIQPDVIHGALINKAQVLAGGNSWEISAIVTIPALSFYLPICFKNYCPDFFDAFQNPNSGWLVVDDADLQTEYVGEEYRMLGKDPDYIYFIKAPTCKRENYTVEADARWVGNTGYGYGLLFGLVDDFSQFYMVIINSDYQIYSLYYYDPNGYNAIVSNYTSYAILPGANTNHIKVTREGSKITLWINNVQQGQWADSRISGLTSVGLVNVPYDDLANADARFDNFRAVRLAAAGSGAVSSSDQSAETIPAMEALKYGASLSQGARLFPATRLARPGSPARNEVEQR